MSSMKINIYFFLITYFTVFLGFISQFFLSNIFSLEELGSLRTMLASSSIFLTILAFGFDTAIYTLASQGKKEHIDTAISFQILFFICLYLLFIFYVFNISSIQDKDIFLYFILNILSAGIFSLVFNEKLGKSKRLEASYLQIKFKIAIVVASIFSAYYYGLMGYVLSILTFQTLIIILELYKINYQFILIKTKLFEIFKISLPSFISIFLFTLAFNMDLIMMDIYSYDLKNVGLFSFSLLYYFVLAQISGVIQKILMPELTKYSNKRFFKSTKFLKTFFMYQLGLILSTIIFGYILYETFDFIDVTFFNSKFTESKVYVFLFVLKAIVFSSFSLVGIAIFSLRNYSYNIYLSLFLFIITYIGLYFSIPTYDIEVVLLYEIYAISISAVVYYIFFYKTFLAFKQLKIDELSYHSIKPENR